MFITWHGLNCIRIQEKETLVTCDPFSKSAGLNPPRSSISDIITLSQPGLAKELGNLKEGVLLLDRPGEFEKKGILINGIEVPGDKKHEPNIVYTFKIGDVTACHVGNLRKELDDSQLDAVDNVDVLLVPVGGGDYLDTEGALKIINQIEPRIVIPMAYKVPGLKIKLETLDKFAKEMGAAKQKALPKIKIVKKDLPQEDTEVIILECQSH